MHLRLLQEELSWMGAFRPLLLSIITELLRDDRECRTDATVNIHGVMPWFLEPYLSRFPHLHLKRIVMTLAKMSYSDNATGPFTVECL